ncbi:MAG: kelch repeat-containing protein [Planctomycetota bacterium]
MSRRATVVGRCIAVLLGVALPAQLQWEAHPAFARFVGPAAFDFWRDRLVAFDPVDGSTWSFDATHWRREPGPAPPPRDEAAMCFDGSRGEILLFGGTRVDRPGRPFGDTWTWNGVQWRERTVGVSPQPRFGHALADDLWRQRVVLFGGTDGFALGADTWEWDGAGWIARANQGAGQPVPRSHHCLAFDAVRGHVLLHGGFNPAALLSDTWVWSGANGRWTNVPATGPPPRTRATMAFDVQRRRTVLFGGRPPGPTVPELPRLDDVWEWDGAVWTRRVGLSGPGGRELAVLAYDAVRDRLLLHGGTPKLSGSPSSDVWHLHGGGWTRLVPAQAPLMSLAMAFAADRDRVVVFGGLNAFRVHAETWEWDGSVWRDRLPGLSPPAASIAACAYDSVRREVVLVCSPSAAQQSETWVWNGARWQQRPAAPARPISNAAMAFDVRRQRAVLFGGFDATRGTRLSDTWEWDGAAWTDARPAGQPAARDGHALAYDLHRGVTVMFGGVDRGGLRFDDTWEYDGSLWSRRQPTRSPPASTGHALVYDEARRRTVLACGEASGASGAAVWEWDGAEWTVRLIPGGPTFGRGAYDSRRSRVLVFGPDGAGAGAVWGLAPEHAASVKTFGRGCAGSLGALSLVVRDQGLPWLGDRIELSLAPAPAGRTAITWFGTSATSWGALLLPAPLDPSGMPGCGLLAGLEVHLVGQVDASGTAVLPVMLPVDAALNGVRLFAQAAVVDPPANAAGLVLANGLALQLGSR